MNFGLPTDVVLWWLWLRITVTFGQREKWVVSFFLWWLFTKVVKRIGLYRRDWRDIIFLPVAILWGWFHGFVKLYALFTLDQVSEPPSFRATALVNHVGRLAGSPFLG